MSLLELLKDKPPVVSDGDIPWPPPNKNVDVSSSSTAAPFLTSSPLFPAKRTPSLREFLNPNYRGKKEEKEKDSISEPSDLLLAIEKNKSSNNLSKTDFDLQKKIRHKSLNVNYSSKEKVQERIAKNTEETSSISVLKNPDSEDSGSAETKKDEKLQTSILGNLTSTEKVVFQQDVAEGVDNPDTVSEINVFLDNTTNQEISVTDSDVVIVKRQENGLSVHADKIPESKRIISETKSVMTDDKSMERAKIISVVEKQGKKSNQIKLNDKSDDHSLVYANKVLTPKRKISEFESGLTEKELVKRVRRISQDYCSGVIPGMCGTQNNELKDSAVCKEQGLSLKNDGRNTQDSDQDKYNTEVHKVQAVTLEPDMCNTQDNELEECIVNDKLKEDQNLMSKNNNSDRKETLSIENKAQELTLKADEENSKNDGKESIDKEHIQEHLSENPNIDQDIGNNAQDLPLKADEGSKQSNDVEESIGKAHVEEGLSVESDSHTCNKEERMQATENKAQELLLKADDGSTQGNDEEESMDEAHKEQEHLPLTKETMCQEFKSTLQDEKTLSLKTDTMCRVQTKDALTPQNRKKEAQELSLMTDTCMKGNDIVIDTTENKGSFEKGIRSDNSKISLSNTKSETKGFTENKTELFKHSQEDIFNIPKIPQNVKSQTSLRQKIFTTDSSESSSTETEASETDVKEAANQNQGSKEFLSSNVKPVLKFKSATESDFNPAKDLTETKVCNLSQDIRAQKTLDTNDSCTQISLKDNAIDSNSGSEEDGSTDEDKDEGQGSTKLEKEEEEAIEILVFNDSDDDDDGLEDGEIEEESSDESFKSVEGMDRLEEDEVPCNESKDKAENKKITLGNIGMPKGSKRRRKKKTKGLSKQGTPKKINVPTKESKDDLSTRRSFKKPMADQSTTCKPEPINEKPNEDENQEEFSLLSTLTSTAVMDVTVAASEKELIKKKSRGGKVSAKKRKKLQRRMNEHTARRAEIEMRRLEIIMEPLPMPICLFYLSGSCNKGDGCQFRHEGTPTKRPHLCKYYVMGVCEKGDNCLYQHSAYPCKNFHLGSRVCSYEDRCKFSHDAPTPETQVLFDQLFAESIQAQNTTLTDVGDGNNQNGTATSTNGTNLPPIASVKQNLYSVRYSSIDEEDCEGSDSVVREGSSQSKDCEEKTKAAQQDESSQVLTPSYVVPGMYTS